MNRRTLLQRAGTAAVLPSLASTVTRLVRGSGQGSPLAGGDPRSGDPSSTTTLASGTEHATPVYVNDAEADGPTALVVGGMHGDERPGYLAAERLRSRVPAAGTLVVLPRANRVAIERGTRAGEGGDLNRQFPAGSSPETGLADEIWDLVERRDPDVVVDLHRSLGIYGRHHASVGQAVFPADVGEAPTVAADVVDVLNDDAVPWYMPLHEFERGRSLSGDRPMLVHKVAGDLERPGYLVETTQFLVDTSTQAEWLALAATALLERHGVELAPDDGASTTGGPA
ncbi:succinylglutamate desuccinylase/aspartoacylase family protein [Halorarum salinum]|uniref:Succinylglutamate desuccinylase/aspartoacylase family protein n=1 Tax=Halorarum salinum TaxID=2743089 RepID=A0A7D5QE71_9EURY|nr:succinylglutamate desuccinylase/aspartoacylase family protein [Halobaculum salinum]QLG62681.1 succinylglutamate desuccinylase/aspartoacylase family protein [Halobaculum salinum]